VAGERGYSVDEAGFQDALATHRDLSGGSVLEAYGAGVAYYAGLLDQLRAEGKLGAEGVEHDPYRTTQAQAPLVALVRDGQRVQSAQPGDEVEVVLPFTPFYVEAGGQVSDTGRITADAAGGDWQIEVTDMRRP
jgi:alanyl-tRNA synthetase